MLNKEKLEKAGIDYEQGIKHFACNTEIYEKYLLRFKDDPIYGELCVEIEAGDYNAAFRNAHALIGVTGNLGMMDFGEKVSNLIEELRHGKYDNMDALLVDFRASYARTVEALL